MLTDGELYRRGVNTLLASWEAYAHALRDAGVDRLAGVSAAIFPSGPERDVYNNAILERAEAIDAMESLYAAAGVGRFAAWVHERDGALARELERRGYVLDMTTRAMGMALDELPVARPQLELSAPDWDEYLRMFGLPATLLAGADRVRLQLTIARLDGVGAAASLAFDCADDCGIYNIGTVPHARRRGLGTGITALALHEARARGCTTASLQSTPMAERLYAALGFRDLGRYLEYVPGQPAW
jgi:ribosomal protein S18 acetylase RimI-like enzyme